MPEINTIAMEAPTRSRWTNVPEDVKNRMIAAELLAKQAGDTTTPVYSTAAGVAKLGAGLLAGILGGYEERKEADAQAKAQKISGAATIKAAGLNPDGTPWTPTPAVPPDVSTAPVSSPAATDAPAANYGNAIASIESGGKYDALGPVTKSGDRAYGKYQVMGANIPQWTKTHLGQEMTPDQFVASPQAQDAVFKGQFGQYAQKYGPEGAARAWFAGEGGMNNPNAKDRLGTSVSSYADKFNRALGAQGGTQTNGQPPAPSIPSVFPDPSSPASLGGIGTRPLSPSQRGPMVAALLNNTGTMSDALPIGMPNDMIGVGNSQVPRGALLNALSAPQSPTQSPVDPKALAAVLTGYKPVAPVSGANQPVAQVLAPQQSSNVAPSPAQFSAALPQRPQFSPQELQAIINNPRLAPEIKQQVLKSQSPDMELIQGKDGGLYAVDKKRPGQPVRIGSLPTEKFETVNDDNGRPIGQRSTLTGKMEGLPNNSTSDIKEWQFYADGERKAGRTPDDFTGWTRANKKAGATNVDASTRAENEESKERGKGLAKRLNDVADDGAKAAEDGLMFQRFGDLLSTVKTGGRTAMLEKVRQMTNGVVTLDPKTDEVQALNAAINHIAPRLRVAGSGSQSDRELANFLNSIPSLAGTPEGNAKILQGLQGAIEYRRAAAEIATQYQVGDITGKEATARIAALPSPFAAKKDDATTTTATAPPIQALDALRSNPSLKADFDAKYGAGAAERALKGGR